MRVTAMDARVVRMSAVLAALTGAVAAGGCGPSNGSGSAPPSCLQVQPCGGDVVGTWSFLGACRTPAVLQNFNDNLQASCPGASITALDIDISGTVTYNADLTYAANVTETIRATEIFPLSCLGFASCADVVSSNTESTVSCTGTTTCTCRVAGAPPMIETGTYTTAGTDLTMAGPTSTSTDAYCVQNNQLHIISVDATSAALNGDFVAQKQ
jgi:hypothetical protein